MRTKRWTKVFQANHHTSKACRNTQWRKYVSFSVPSSTIFFSLVLRLRIGWQVREIGTLLHNGGDSRSNLNFRFEHCRLNYSLLAIGMCLLLWIYMLDAQLFQCMLCTNTPVFGNSTITNQQQIINSHSVDPTEFPIVLRSLCAHSIRIFLYFCVLDKSTAVLWDCVRRWRRGRQRERERGKAKVYLQFQDIFVCWRNNNQHTRWQKTKLTRTNEQNIKGNEEKIKAEREPTKKSKITGLETGRPSAEYCTVYALPNAKSMHNSPSCGSVAWIACMPGFCSTLTSTLLKGTKKWKRTQKHCLQH